MSTKVGCGIDELITIILCVLCEFMSGNVGVGNEGSHCRKEEKQPWPVWIS